MGGTRSKRKESSRGGLLLLGLLLAVALAAAAWWILDGGKRPEEPEPAAVTRLPDPGPEQVGPSPALTGWVMDHDTRKGIAGITVIARCQEGSDPDAVVLAGADGRFELGSLPDGLCTIRASGVASWPPGRTRKRR